MEKRFEILPPIMPNFVQFKNKAGLKQDGFKVNDGFDIADFTQQEAEEYAELMRQTFLEHYAKRKQENRIQIKRKADSIAAFLNFPANNQIVYFQDFQGFKGVPPDVNFYPTEIVNETVCFVADGYGMKGKYGNGAIFVPKKFLPVHIVEWCANNLLQTTS